MNIISLVNQKGGVSKTTSTHNIGAALSELGKKVLLVDLDPQGNLTSGTGIVKMDLDKCIYDLLLDDMVEVSETIIKLPEFDVIPATIKLAIADNKLINEYARERKLLDKLEEIDGQYDYVLIDCPPSLSILTINALIASNYVLIPVKMEKYAFDGIVKSLSARIINCAVNSSSSPNFIFLLNLRLMRISFLNMYPHAMPFMLLLCMNSAPENGPS